MADDPPADMSAPQEEGAEPVGGLLETAEAYAASVRLAKSSLSMSLKLLAIASQADGEAGRRESGDKLYLSKVMLNSSLLKALHVADSFQQHFQADFPKLFDGLEDAASDHQAVAAGDEEAVRAAAACEDGRLPAPVYRRLQAGCVLLQEAARALEASRDADKVRVQKLEAACQELRDTLQRLPSEEVMRDSSLLKALPEDAEISRLSAEVGDLKQHVEELSAQELRVSAEAKEAAAKLAAARKQREELQELLGVGGEELQGALRELVDEVQGLERTEAAEQKLEEALEKEALEREALEREINRRRNQAPLPQDAGRGSASQPRSAAAPPHQAPQPAQSQRPEQQQPPSGRRPMSLLEDRQVARAALRFVRNPGDPQALRKLASLSGSKFPARQGSSLAAAQGPKQGPRPRPGCSLEIPAAGRSPSPAGPAPAASPPCPNGPVSVSSCVQQVAAMPSREPSVAPMPSRSVSPQPVTGPGRPLSPQPSGPGRPLSPPQVMHLARPSLDPSPERTQLAKQLAAQLHGAPSMRASWPTPEARARAGGAQQTPLAPSLGLPSQVQGSSGSQVWRPAAAARPLR